MLVETSAIEDDMSEVYVLETASSIDEMDSAADDDMATVDDDWADVLVMASAVDDGIYEVYMLEIASDEDSMSEIYVFDGSELEYVEVISAAVL